ncbi:ACSM3 synthetase, partial [Loxia leucoptera]|nr:ACSM3 synthetase [Loxia leucoptera]
RYWLKLTPSDIIWNTSDTGWVKAAWSSLFAAWICGSCVFVHNMPQFKPEVIAETLSKYPITTFCTAPTAFLMLVQHDMSRYSRKGREAGVKAVLPVSLLCPALSCSRCSSELIKAPLLCLSFLQIVDEHGAVVPKGEEGTIAIRVKPTRPFCLFSEYL